MNRITTILPPSRPPSTPPSPRSRSLTAPAITIQPVAQHEADQGLRPDLPSSEEREEIRQLKRENAELRKANEILRAASLFFATEVRPELEVEM